MLSSLKKYIFPQENTHTECVSVNGSFSHEAHSEILIQTRNLCIFENKKWNLSIYWAIWTLSTSTYSVISGTLILTTYLLIVDSTLYISFLFNNIKTSYSWTWYSSVFIEIVFISAEFHSFHFRGLSHIFANFIAKCLLF